MLDETADAVPPPLFVSVTAPTCRSKKASTLSALIWRFQTHISIRDRRRQQFMTAEDRNAPDDLMPHLPSRRRPRCRRTTFSRKASGMEWKSKSASVQSRDLRPGPMPERGCLMRSHNDRLIGGGREYQLFAPAPTIVRSTSINEPNQLGKSIN